MILDRFAHVLQIIPGLRSLHPDFLQNVRVIVHRPCRSQIRNRPDRSVHNRLVKEGFIHLGVGFLRDIILGRKKKSVCLVVGKDVNIQDIRRLIVCNPGVDCRIDVVP